MELVNKFKLLLEALVQTHAQFDSVYYVSRVQYLSTQICTTVVDTYFDDNTKIQVFIWNNIHRGATYVLRHFNRVFSKTVQNNVKVHFGCRLQESSLRVLSFQDDLKLIENKTEEGYLQIQKSKLQEYQYDLSGYHAAQEILVKMMGLVNHNNNNTQSLLQNALETCNTSMSAEVMGVNASTYSLPDDSFWTHNHSCDSLLQDLSDTYDDDLSDVTLEKDFEALTKYEENVDRFFGFQFSITRCTSVRDVFLNATNSLTHLVNSAIDMISSTDMQEALQHYSNSGHTAFKYNFTETTATFLILECNLFFEILENQQHTVGWGDVVSKGKEMLKTKYSRHVFLLLMRVIGEGFDSVNDLLDHVSDMSRDFLKGNITKGRVAALWKERGIEQLKPRLDFEHDRLRQMYDPVRADILQSFFESLYTLPEPLEMDEQGSKGLPHLISQMDTRKLVSLFKPLYENDAEAGGSGLPEDDTFAQDIKNLSTILKTFFDRAVDTKPVTNLLEKASEQMQELETLLNDFQKATELDVEFYMQVAIFIFLNSFLFSIFYFFRATTPQFENNG